MAVHWLYMETLMTIILYALALTVGFILGSALTALAFTCTGRVQNQAALRRVKKAEVREDVINKEVSQVGKVIP